METKRIKVLLHSYYEGTSTEHEEKLLYEYFSGNDVSDDLINEKDFFLSLHAVKKLPVDIPEGFDARLENFMNTLDESNETQPKNCIRVATKLRLLLGMAASVLVLIVAGLCLNSKEETCELSEADRLALVKAESAIVLFSSKVNKGFEQFDMASVKVEKIGNMLDKYEQNNNNK